MDVLAKLLQIAGLCALGAGALLGHWGRPRPGILAAAISGLALVVGSGLQVWATVALLADRLGIGVVALAVDYLVTAEVGRLAVARVGLALAAVLAVVAFVAAPLGGTRRQLTAVAAIFFAAAVAYTIAASGHAGAMPDGGAVVLAQCGHLLVGTGWVAAVAALAWLGAAGRAEAAEIAARLSMVGPVALIAVLVLAVTGPALAVLHGMGLQSLGATDYGRTAVAKAVLFGAALAPAAYNRWVGLPALRRDAEALPRVRAALFVELSLIALVLAAAAALTQTPPPH